MLKTQDAVQPSPNARVNTHSQKPAFIANQRNWLLMVPLLLLVTWLAAQHLNGAFWVDEIITVERAGAPIHGGPFSPAQIWERTADDTYDQVPGYFWLVAAWDNLLGWSEFSTRLLSLFAGLLAVAWTYRLGRDLHSPLAGVGAAVALGASAYFIYYLHEARVYAPAVLLCAATIWLYWRVVTRRAGWAAQVALVLCAAAVLYAHYFAALLIFSICLYHLLFVPKNREWWRVVMAMAVAGTLFSPWFLTSFDAIQGANRETWRQELSLGMPEILNALLSSFANGGVALMLLVGVLAARIRRPAERYMWFVLLVPLALALAVNAWLEMLVSLKFVLYLWTPLALVFGVGLAWLVARGLHPALLLVPWLIVGTWSALTWQASPVEYVEWQVLRDQLAPQAQASDAVVFHMEAGLWDGDHPRIVRHYFHDFPAQPRLLISWPHDTDARYLETLDPLISEKQRVWSAYDPQRRPARIETFEAALQERGFADCGSAMTAPEMQVDLFARAPEDLPYQFGGDLYDDGIAMGPLGAMTENLDGSLLILLGWRMSQDVPVNTYSFAVHVLDAGGALAAQADVGLPPDYAFGCRAVQIPDLAPGEYQIALVVYAWETGSRLNTASTEGLSEGERVHLGTLTLSA